MTRLREQEELELLLARVGRGELALLDDDDATEVANAHERYDLLTEGVRGFIARNSPQHTPIPSHLSLLVDTMDRAMREPMRITVCMPPRHGKTVTMASTLACMASLYPEALNAFLTYNQRKANNESRVIRRLAIANGFVPSADQNLVSDWRNDIGGGLVAAGLRGPLNGVGVTGIEVVDDPFKNREEAESINTRDRVWDWFTTVAYTRLQPEGSCVLSVTRWNADDVRGRIEKELTGENWIHIDLPAVRHGDELRNDPCDDFDAPDARALWPEQYPLEKLRLLAKALTPYGFSALFQQRPRPKGGKVFERLNTVEKPLEGAFTRVIVIDPAGSERKAADFSAIIVARMYHRDDEHVMYVEHCEQWQAKNDFVAKRLLALHKRFSDARIVYEASRDGIAIMASLFGIAPALQGLCTKVRPVGDKFTRAQDVSAANNDKRVLVQAGEKWVEEFWQEVSTFTGVSDPHDDIVDALSYAWIVLRYLFPIKPKGDKRSVAVVRKQRVGAFG